MIKILTGNQMKNIDKRAIADLNIPSLILMENAGRSVAQVVLDEIGDNCIEPDVIVICGKGNNGGDGFVAARHLIEAGMNVYTVSIYRPDNLSGDTLINHNILEHFTEINYLDELDIETLKDIISSSEAVIDAILGTGLAGEVHKEIAEIIDAINEFAEGIVVSIDIPSGIDSNTGRILGTSVIADYTATFYAPKLGSVVFPGADFSGEVIINEIGIPAYLLDDTEYNTYFITREYVSASLPIRPTNSHKGSFGSVFNIAGSFGMSGAAHMSAISSLKAGAGYSILAAPESIIPTLASMSPEIIYLPLQETLNKTISLEAVSNALDKSARCNSFLIGPGLGTDLSTIGFVSEFIGKLADRDLRCVIDADALNCLAEKEDFTFPLKSIITPHPKELSRLLKIPVEEILEDRIKAARKAALKFNTIVILKGARTVISEPDGTVYINPTGNTALSTAGSGDVLSGMIAGFIAQGVELKDAAILGVYLHGLTGELASEDLTEAGTTSSDLIKYIPEALKEIVVLQR